MKAVQKFSDDYLESCREMTPDQIIAFLEDFRRLHSVTLSGPSRLISMKVPEDLLSAFKAKAKLEGIPYQSKIKVLMKDWLLNTI
jgi:predicted DNA binding CopG/RHH family protein